VLARRVCWFSWFEVMRVLHVARARVDCSGNDLRTVGRDYPDCLALILNPEIVAVNQDRAARPPVLVSQAVKPPSQNRSAVPDGKHTLAMLPCNSSTVQLLPWKLQSDHSLRAGGSSAGCLDAYQCGTADGTSISVFLCHPNNTCPSKLKGCMCGYKNQQWHVNSTAGTIQNANSGMPCLTVRTERGRNSVSLSKCVGSTAQLFSLSAEGEVVWAGSGGHANSQTAASKLCLVAGAYVPPAAPVGGPTSLDITAQVFARPMGYTAAVQDIAVVLLNRAGAATNLSVSWDELGEYTSKCNRPFSWNANVAAFERQANGANGKVTKLMPCVKQALLQGSVCVCVTLCIARTCRTQLEASLLRLIATTFHLFGSRSSSELAVAVLLSVGCDTSFDRLINALRW
jgi:hypothetical protein